MQRLLACFVTSCDGPDAAPALSLAATVPCVVSIVTLPVFLFPCILYQGKNTCRVQEESHQSQKNHISSTFDIYGYYETDGCVEKEVPTLRQNFCIDFILRYLFS